ncbi:VOC family protein [Chitinophaga rhizophila]|uniref:VOC family protein n=1 Tax=Chitinophaga rhizophila TaxID=2866212 RepID=A0ABS7GA54_9BACT|nr:VOC family protein [Chitinophaga rhizophila]MBW8684529.1 VOC family protein [Chitinophaga rhizophila]
MVKEIFVNLPVKDLDKSKAFFTAIGFTFNAQFTNEQGACLVLSENIYAMLLVEEFFSTFIKKGIADASKVTEVINAVSVESKEKVHEVVDKALAAGAVAYNEPQDHGWMYSRAFQDLDGHLWEVLYSDPTAFPAN